MNRYILPFLAFLLLFSSCKNDMDGWEKTKEYALVFHDADSFFGGEYTWYGDTLEFSVANGPGTLTFTDKFNKSNNFSTKTNLYYGSLEKPTDIKNFTVGNTDKKGRFQNFGVKVNGDIIEIGYFTNNELDGNGVIYKNNKLEYIGNLKKGVKQGEGKLFFADGKTIKYIGTFKKGNYNGHGVLYDSIGRKIYEGKFSKGFYNGYGVSYDSLGHANKHVWSKGGLDKTTYTLYQNLNLYKNRFNAKQLTNVKNRILKWERYHIWMYIGWSVFSAILLLSCALVSLQEDKETRYNRAKPWNKYTIWTDWLFFGWLGVHRYVLKSKLGLAYPALIVCLLIANIRESSIYLFYPSTWCMWEIGSFSYICIIVMITCWIFDFFWIPWRCYFLNHTYFRHDKNETSIRLHKETPIMAFGNSVKPIAITQANILSDVLCEIKSIHSQEFKGKKGLMTRIGRAFTGNDQWLDFEIRRAKEIQANAKKAEIAQNKYAELCEQLNSMLEESRANAYRNFTLAKELISKAVNAKGKTQVLVKDVSLNTDRLNISVSVETLNNVQAGIDWESTTNSAIESSMQLLSMGIKGPWAIGIGVGASLLAGVLNSIQAAQTACEEANKQCEEAIIQLGTITNAVMKSQAAILCSGEMVIALNKANAAFWLAYIDLRDRIFTTKPTIKQFLFGTRVKKEDLVDPAFRESIVHLTQVCSEYNKINSAKL